ncbi:MAG: hypothetical protein BRC34_08070 [Cyanobacteria bacterium QH_1_48_107]|nr:MAG: hypothetical protein BRC34_08070 [Cyanobacteria bacterium QH_1_48_107]
MKNAIAKLPTDTWVVATWEEYIEAIASPAYEQARGYYHDGRMRIEMAPIGYDHSCDHTIILFAVNLFCSIKGIPITGLTGCSFRKPGLKECQPDVAYYIGESAQVVPRGTKIVSLDSYPPPDLAIEVGDTTLSDELGNKRILYEELSVAEYWVVDVQKAQLKAFAVADGGSRRISESQVLPGLAMSFLEEALRRSREANQAQVGAWLLQTFQSSDYTLDN